MLNGKLTNRKSLCRLWLAKNVEKLVAKIAQSAEFARLNDCIKESVAKKDYRQFVARACLFTFNFWLN